MEINIIIISRIANSKWFILRISIIHRYIWCFLLHIQFHTRIPITVFQRYCASSFGIGIIGCRCNTQNIISVY